MSAKCPMCHLLYDDDQHWRDHAADMERGAEVNRDPALGCPLVHHAPDHSHLRRTASIPPTPPRRRYGVGATDTGRERPATSDALITCGSYSGRGPDCAITSAPR